MLGVMNPIVGYGVLILISDGLETLLGDVFGWGVVPLLGVLIGYDLSSSIWGVISVSSVMVGFPLSSLLWVLFSFLFSFSSFERFISGLQNLLMIKIKVILPIKILFYHDYHFLLIFNNVFPCKLLCLTFYLA